MDIAEVMGTRRLFDFVHDNPAVNMEPSDVHPRPRGDRRRSTGFVSINSALEIDLGGQVTAESLGGRQVAGIGGQFDFVLGASRAARRRVDHRAAVDGPRRGGLAHRAAAWRAGAAVTTPRYLADYVVTEYGRGATAGLGEIGLGPRR